MLRSMYSAIGGLKNFQTKLDVIGNNIANVNTYGFKKGRVTFKDLVSQQISGASAPTNNRGGVNPKQVGLGSTIGSIDNIHTQGSLQTTGRALDLAISGEGFFRLEDGSSEYFTRAGNFYLDEDGNLVSSEGLYVLDEDGAHIDIDKDQYSSFSIGSSGEITGVDSNGNANTIATIGLAKFNNPGGLQKAGGNLYQETNNSGDPQYEIPGDNIGTLVAGTLEMSNVDLAKEFTEMIVAQRGFQANARVITTSDKVLQELVNLKR